MKLRQLLRRITTFETDIGGVFRRDRRAAIAASVFTALMLPLFFLLALHVFPYRPWGWPAVAWVCIVPYPFLRSIARADHKSIGFRLPTKTEWGRWSEFASVCAIALVIVVLFFRVLRNRGWFEVATPDVAPELFVLNALIVAPLLEEMLFRALLCSVLRGFLGNWATILIGGAVFAGAHFIYGTASLENFLAGYLLCYVFLRSSSLLVPVLMHSGGNAIMLILHYT